MRKSAYPFAHSVLRDTNIAQYNITQELKCDTKQLDFGIRKRPHWLYLSAQWPGMNPSRMENIGVPPNVLDF